MECFRRFVAFKPTQAREDSVGVALLLWLIEKTQITVSKRYKVDYLAVYREQVEKIAANLPPGFTDGLSELTGEVKLHIADTNYGLLQHDMLDRREVIVFSTDLDGDRLTDQMADTPDVFRKLIALTLQAVDQEGREEEVWKALGFEGVGNGRDMTSVMSRMEGPPIFEQTLGSADDMLLRLLKGNERLDLDGVTPKKPYDPRIHFVLIADAYRAANPDNRELSEWLDSQLAQFDKIYGVSERPGFIEGYNTLKEAITPWGS